MARGHLLPALKRTLPDILLLPTAFTAGQVSLFVVPETSAVSLLGLATLFTLRRQRNHHAA